MTDKKSQPRKELREEHRAEICSAFDDFDEVFTFENLYASYKKCRRGVGWKVSTQIYNANALLNVYRTYKRLHDGTFRSDGFFEFDIIERGKPRHIQSVTIRERVVQRCLCDYSLTPILSRSFIYDNGACLKGKGCSFTAKRFEKHLHDHIRRYGTDGYILIFDFSKYFENVSHELLFSILESVYTDRRILALLRHFIEAFGDKGLGLGSQISQILALAAADSLDHYIKERLRIKGYDRYMDDGVLISHSREVLVEALDEIERICASKGITLNPKKTRIQRITQPFSFLKVRYFVTESGKVIKKPNPKGIAKMRQKLRSFKELIDAGEMTEGQAKESFQAYIAHIDRLDSNKTESSLIHHFISLFTQKEETYGQIQSGGGGPSHH